MKNIDRTIIADIGGTNARFAVTNGDSYDHVKILRTKDYSCLSDALNAYAGSLDGPRPDAAFLGIAGPPPDDTFMWPNGWSSFSVAEEGRRAGMRLSLLNDFQAAALGLPHLKPSQRRQIMGGVPLDHAPISVVGPGTGLGAASLTWDGAQYNPKDRGDLPDMPVNTPRDLAIRGVLEKKYGHVFVDQVCRGQGLVNIHDALCELENRTDLTGRTPAEISRAALSENPCPIAREALDRMMEYLGFAAAYYARKADAKGGVYIAGGIVTKLGDYFDSSPFRHAFAEYAGKELDSVPVYVVTEPDDLAFIGLSASQPVSPQPHCS